VTRLPARATRTIRAPRLLAAVAVLAVLSAGAAGPAAPAGPDQRAADFDTLWRAIDTSYAYFDGEAAREAWKRSRATWRARARNAATQRAFIAALEGALDTLHEPHATLSQRTPESARRIPAETDVWARWKDGAARVEAVRIYGDADMAGLRPGDVVMRVQGVDVEQAVR
jgi:C-terminal processing protease CtpA/Prc